MNILNKKIKLLSILVVFSFVSCTDDFFDVNDNPNDPTVSTPKLTLPVAQQNLAAINATTMTYLGQMMAYNWATPYGWAANSDFLTYNVTPSFQQSIFEGSYSAIFKNLTYIQEYKDPEGLKDYSFYKAISLIMKAYQYQYLVDLYGDVPYSEANKRGQNTTPKYDDAETIYKDLIGKLTKVVIDLENLSDTAENPKDNDIIFKGNKELWQKFANSIKLRMLIRLSNTNQEPYIKAEFAKIDANGKGYIGDNVFANPGYSDNGYKLNPFYGDFRIATTGKENSRSNYTVATDHTLSFLSFTNDPRIGKLYAKSQKGGVYKGVKQALDLPKEGNASEDLSKIGDGLIKSPDQDQPLMLLSEVLLLRAEAVYRGYITGDAEELYNKAIKESFKFLGVEDAENKAEAYYNQALRNVSFSSSSDKLEAIITQKWIALNGTSSIELWIEYNRTGYPSGLPVAVDSRRPDRPKRLLYPTSEISTNSNNVPRQTKEDAYTKIFYQK